MGKTFDYVPVQLTKAFREAQADEKFQGWLKMQEAAMGIEFPIYDLPEVRDSMFTKDSLATVEAKLTELYDSNQAAYDGEENVHRTMRYVYYIGETFRRAFEGTWVAIPPGEDSRREALLPGIDLPFGKASSNRHSSCSLRLPAVAASRSPASSAIWSGRITSGSRRESRHAPTRARCARTTRFAESGVCCTNR